MARLPHIRAPMAATQVARSFHRPGWIYEEKVDGWHVLAYKDAAGVRLVSRNARDLTRRFPELAAAVAELKPPTLILDGEIAVFDRQLLSHFEWIRARPKDQAATPPTLIAFDCCTRGARTSRSGRCGCGGTCSRNSSTASSWCSRRGGSPTTGSTRGLRCSSAATKGWSGRTTAQPMWRAGRSRGSR